jgi:hypothetical protein
MRRRQHARAPPFQATKNYYNSQTKKTKLNSDCTIKFVSINFSKLDLTWIYLDKVTSGTSTCADSLNVCWFFTSYISRWLRVHIEALHLQPHVFALSSSGYILIFYTSPVEFLRSKSVVTWNLILQEHTYSQSHVASYVSKWMTKTFLLKPTITYAYFGSTFWL